MTDQTTSSEPVEATTEAPLESAQTPETPETPESPETESLAPAPTDADEAASLSEEDVLDRPAPGSDARLQELENEGDIAADYLE